MWLSLTMQDKNGQHEEVVVNMGFVTHFTPYKQEDATTIYFAATVDEKQKAIRVTQSTTEILSLLEATR